MRSWKHSGFSVHQSVRLEAGDTAGIQRLLQYFLRCPFSQARMIEVTEAGKVIYKSDHNAVRRFPEPGDEELLAGPARNFQVFDPLDFLAEVTQRIPDLGPPHPVLRLVLEQTRGQTAKRQPPAAAAMLPVPRSPTAREARKGWAALIRQVCESDPLSCPKCGATMRIIAFIERHQTDVIEKILRHCGLWEQSPARDPPCRRSGWRSRAKGQAKEDEWGGRAAFRCVVRLPQAVASLAGQSNPVSTPDLRRRRCGGLPTRLGIPRRPLPADAGRGRRGHWSILTKFPCNSALNTLSAGLGSHYVRKANSYQ